MPPRLTTQATFLTGSRAIAQALNALASMIAVRHLAAGDFATFRQVYLLHMILIQVSDLGVAESLFYYVPRETTRRRSLMFQSLSVVIAAQAVTFVTLFTFRDQLASRMNNPGLAEVVWALGLFTAFMLTSRVWEVQLVAEGRAVYAAAIILGFETFRAALLFGVLFYKPTIEAVAVALAVGSGARVVAYAAFLSRLSQPSAGSMQTPWKERMRYAMGLWLPGSLNVAAIYAHQVIVSVLFSPEQFAIYSVACFQIPFLGALTTSAAEVLLVRVTRDRQLGDTPSILSAWQGAIKKAAFVFIPIAILCMTISEPMMTALFTRNYRASAPLFALIVSAIPFQGLFQDSVLRGLGAMRAYSLFYYLRAALSLLLGAALTIFLGLWGAALSTVITVVIHNGIQLRYLGRTLSLPVKEILPWTPIAKILLVSLISAIPAALCAWWITRPILAAASGAVLFGLTYGWLSIVLVKTLGDETPGLDLLYDLWKSGKGKDS